MVKKRFNKQKFLQDYVKPLGKIPKREQQHLVMASKRLFIMSKLRKYEKRTEDPEELLEIYETIVALKEYFIFFYEDILARKKIEEIKSKMEKARLEKD